jgi:hypothetical protein
MEGDPYPQRAHVSAARAAAAAVKLSADDLSARDGAKIARRLHELRIHAISASLAAEAPLG